MANFIALYDSNVLYPAPLRNLLMHLAMSDLFRAKWTNAIHEEWIRNLLKNRNDLTRAKLEKIRDLMNENILDCVVEGYEEIIPSLILPDPNDRHILAAAIISNASVIVSFNLKHFPEKHLSKYGIEAQNPDDFLLNLFDISAEKVCTAVKRSRINLKKPSFDVEEYLSCLEKQNLLKIVNKLNEYREFI